MVWHFMQIVSYGDNLHEMSNNVLLEKLEKNISKHLPKILPSMLRITSIIISVARWENAPQAYVCPEKTFSTEKYMYWYFSYFSTKTHVVVLIRSASPRHF